MKKLLLLSILLIPFVSFWQDITKNQSEVLKEESKWTIVQENINWSWVEESNTKLSEIWADGGLWLLWFGFCNEWIEEPTKTINAAVEQWKPFKVCAVRQNNSSSDIEINVAFPLVEYTDKWDKACGKDLSFELFIPEYKNLKTITIPAGNQVIKEFDINFPIWIDGKQDACLIYNIQTQAFLAGQSWLMPRIRKWFFMNFFVWQAGDIKNEVKIENINTALNSNKELILNFDVSNIGNLENTISVSGTISNMFGFKKDFEIVWWVVIPERSLPLEVNLWPLPSYGWLFNIKFSTNTVPHFIYDISTSKIDPNLLEEKSIIVKTTYFQMPRMILWMGIVTILLLFFAFKKPKQKVVYVEKQ